MLKEKKIMDCGLASEAKLNNKRLTALVSVKHTMNIASFSESVFIPQIKFPI